MEINFENIETICRICLQYKETNSLPHELENIFEFSSIYSSITIDSRTISLIDIMTLCLSHKVNITGVDVTIRLVNGQLKFQLSDDKDISQMICNLCVRRLTDCYELKYQIEQSEQLLLSVVSNRLFMGLNNEYSDNNEQQLSKSNSIINETLSSVNDFDTSPVRYEIKDVPKLLHDTITHDIQDLKPQTTENHQLTEKPKPSKLTSKCLICLKKFSATSKLDRHLINQHLVRNDLNVYKPHQCEECSKAYTTKANLVLHRAVHSGKRVDDQFV